VRESTTSCDSSVLNLLTLHCKFTILTFSTIFNHYWPAYT